MKAVSIAGVLLLHVLSVHAAKPGTLLWKHTADGQLVGAPAVADNGAVYFTASISTLHALDANGRHRWSVPSAGYSAPTVGDRAVYIAGGPWNPDGSIRGRIAAYSFGGSLQWSVPTAFSVTTSPSLSDSDNMLYVGSNEGALMATTCDGLPQWTAGGGDWIVGEAAIGLNGSVYFSNGADSPYAHAVSRTGEEIWSAPAPAEMPSPFSIGDDGALYFGLTYELRALNPDGTLRWTAPLGGWAQSPAVIARDGTIYVVSDGTVLHAITPAGVEKWRFTYPNTSTGDSAIPLTTPAVSSDGIIYLGAGHQLLALKPDSKIAWTFPTAGDLVTAPVLSPAANLYFADSANNLYAVRASAPPAPNGWPMFRHDAKGTSKAATKRRSYR